MSTTAPPIRPPGVYTDADWRLLEAFHRLTLGAGLSLAEAAKCIGYKSASSVSTLYDGTYGAGTDRIFRAIRLYLEGVAARAAAVQRVAPLPLDVTADIHGYLDDRRDRGVMGFGCIAPGIGKTVGIELYAASHENVFVVTCKAGITPRYLLERIADQLHITLKTNQSRVKAIGLIADALASTPRALLVIDEADKLHETAETARDLWTEGGQAGHCWFGTKAFWNGLNRRFSSTAGQIARRFGDVLLIDEIGEDDVERILACYPTWPAPVLARARDLGLRNTGRLCEGLATAERYARKTGRPVPTVDQIASAYRSLATTNL